MAQLGNRYWGCFIILIQSVQFTQSCPTLCDLMDCRHQASLSITNSQSLLKLMSIELVMPSNHLILCHPLLLPPSIFPSIRVFSNESVLHIRWPKYWSFSLFWLIHLYKNLGVPLHYNMHVILKHQFPLSRALLEFGKPSFHLPSI